LKSKLLLRAAARFHFRSPLQLALSTSGIALGVAVFVGVNVANTSANAAFDNAADFVRGATTHRLLPMTQWLDEKVFFEQIASHGIVAAPVIEVPIRVSGSRTMATLLGVDAIAETAFRDSTRIGILGGSTSESLITEPDTALASPSLLNIDDQRRISIESEYGIRQLRIVGTLPRDAGIAQLLVVDIATAQEILGKVGQLSRIDLILDATSEAQLRNALPPGTVLVAAGNENAAFRELSNAFRINILALGLLALVVGMFLVYSSANFSLVRRAETFATLHVLGADRLQLAGVITMEFTILGLVSSVIGIAIGHTLAGMLVNLMLMTIDDFSFRSNVAVGSVSPWLYVQGLAIGVIATLIATVAPIRNAIRRDTTAAMRRSALEIRTKSHSFLGRSANCLKA